MLTIVEAERWSMGTHKTVFTPLCTFENSYNKKRKKLISFFCFYFFLIGVKALFKINLIRVKEL